jgi:hypothetical protein
MKIKHSHPVLFQINTRVWLRRFGPQASLADIPVTYWDSLKSQGVDLVWLMGIWQTVGVKQVHRYAMIEELQREYTRALPDWTSEDVIGSPYAVDEYRPAGTIGSWEELAAVRKQLHKRGMGLILDFVPNHFHAETSLIEKHPYLFLPGDEANLKADPSTFYRYNGKIWAHGRDPYFPAWQDTIQVNYFNDQARAFMSEQLRKLAGVCDGVRCDMAMLLLGTVFESTWRHASGYSTQTVEFWALTIDQLRQDYPDFLMIAEAYWDLEWQLQQLGFDYTYDKRLLDRLHEANVDAIRGHLFADPEFRDRSVRFLENHDEDRILKCMNNKQAEAAAVISYTLPGMRFFYDGQWEGRRVRLPVQLGRLPEERPCTCPVNEKLNPGMADGNAVVCACSLTFYQKLMMYLQKPIFHEGEWQQLELAHGGEYVLAWRWQKKKENVIVIINYANHSVGGTLAPLYRENKVIAVKEPWTGESYDYAGSKIFPLHLYPYEYRFLEFTLE